MLCSMKYKIGYTTGVFDMFNIGHLNILRKAKEMCDYLIVGVTSDILFQQRRNKLPIINEDDRMAIVDAIRFVDKVMLQSNINELEDVIRLNVDVVFVGYDHIDLDEFERHEHRFAEVGCFVEHIDSLDNISVAVLQESLFRVDKVHISGECKYGLGYTTGVFDMFHRGHLNLIKRAKEQSDYLVVGVSTDKNVHDYKHKIPTIPYEDRAAIVASIKYVDAIVPQDNMDKFCAWENIHFNALFHGNDWKGSTMYNEVENKLESVGVEMVYFPYTAGISSTIIKAKISK